MAGHIVASIIIHWKIFNGVVSFILHVSWFLCILIVAFEHIIEHARWFLSQRMVLVKLEPPQGAKLEDMDTQAKELLATALMSIYF